MPFICWPYNFFPCACRCFFHNLITQTFFGSRFFVCFSLCFSLGLFAFLFWLSYPYPYPRHKYEMHNKKNIKKIGEIKNSGRKKNEKKTIMKSHFGLFSSLRHKCSRGKWLWNNFGHDFLKFMVFLQLPIQIPLRK